ncbi:MAG: FAD-dependent oxidoreductase [Cyclobacteriaceae bacterium]
MIKEGFNPEKRALKTKKSEADLVIAGGGMAGTCCALTAARQGLKVVLVHDRPVLGGNASSEIRLWILGATSHMGNNNRWAREGGMIDELLVENTYRNPEGNPLILDTILLEKISLEENITLLLNTAVYDLKKKSADEIDSVKAFCSQTSTEYIIKAPLFVDASGDGIVGFLAGAAFRMGAESPEEFDERFAPDHEYGELLGHSMYFYSKDTGKPVKFIPPSYALSDISKLPRFKSFNLQDHGCRLWWVEYGGRLDTIHESEKIKWELWRVLYGIWNHIKNSGEYSDTENLTLEWVGTIPGKRESRRFEGDYMLSQKDVVEQRNHFDAVSYGGWALDLHPADGVFGDKPGCNQWHSKGVYQIPYRCMYSRNIRNLFLAGRIISASHVAFGSSRVMATCAHAAQAVGMAAALCVKGKIYPADLVKQDLTNQLQQELIKNGQYIPGVELKKQDNLLSQATISSSSTYLLSELPADGPWYNLEYPVAQMLPLPAGKLPKISLNFKSEVETELIVELRRSSKTGNFTPDETVKTLHLPLKKGQDQVTIDFDHQVKLPQYYFICLMQNKEVSVKCSETRVTGILTAFKKFNKAVSNFGKQEPPAGIGVESFEFWIPQRRPEGHNLAFSLHKPLQIFALDLLTNGILRPVRATNAWAANLDDPEPEIKIEWDEPKTPREIKFFFDTDFDHPMESTLMGHYEREMPFCVKKIEVFDEQDNLLFQTENNHQTVLRIAMKNNLITQKLRIKLDHPAHNVPAAVFGLLIE